MLLLDLLRGVVPLAPEGRHRLGLYQQADLLHLAVEGAEAVAGVEGEIEPLWQLGVLVSDPLNAAKAGQREVLDRTSGRVEVGGRDEPGAIPDEEAERSEVTALRERVAGGGVVVGTDGVSLADGAEEVPEEDGVSRGGFAAGRAVERPERGVVVEFEGENLGEPGAAELVCSGVESLRKRGGSQDRRAARAATERASISASVRGGAAAAGCAWSARR